MRYILTVILCLHMSSAQAESFSREIEKIQALVLKKERNQAFRHLTKLIKSELKPNQKKEIRKVGNEVSEVFISDKSQQEYEAGLSLWMATPERAIQKFQESLLADSTNFLVISDLARAHVSNKNCKNALEILNEAKNRYEYSDNLNLALTQTYICLQRWTDADKLIIAQKKGEGSEFWYLAEADVAIARKDTTRAKKALANAEKANGAYLETLLRRADLEFEIKNKKTWAEKYVIGCKNTTLSKFRNYKTDPFYCRSVDRMESVIRGSQYED